MLEGEWSDPQSDVTEELGLGSNPAVAAANPSGFAAPARQRCVVPKVQASQRNRSDQRVPVYWDQTVPVWQGGSATKRKARAEGGRGLQGGRSGGASSGENCCCSSGSRRDEYDSGTRRGAACANSSSEVSFDAILSIYESSLVEKSSKWSRRVLPNCRTSRSWWFEARAHHDDDTRRRRFAGRRHISVQLSPPGPLSRDDEAESLRRLRVVIERTRTACAAHCCTIPLPNANAILLSCDFHHPRDPLSFTTPMLTSSFS